MAESTPLSADEEQRIRDAWRGVGSPFKVPTEAQQAVADLLAAARADERAKVTAAVLPLVEAVEDTYDDCTPSRGCTGCELRLYAQRVRAALTTTQPQPTEVAGELWLLDGSGA